MVEEKGRQTADEKEGRKPWTLREFGGQTLWDWLHLLSALAIPVVLAAAGLWFTAREHHGALPMYLYGEAAPAHQPKTDNRLHNPRGAGPT